jgi:hypothetical protein
MKKIILLLLLAANISRLPAQHFTKVLTASDKLLPFADQAQKVNRYFDTAHGSNRSGYKQWKRLEWFAMQHLSANGMLENYGQKNILALASEQQNIQSRSSGNTLINNGGWFNIGYNNVSNGGNTARQGRVNCFAFDPFDANTGYAGTAGGGIWKTQDAGASWFNISDNLPVNSFSSLAVHPGGNIIYALTGDGFDANFYIHDGVGVLKSSDGGSSWQITGLSNNLSQGIGGYKIRIQPGNNNTVIAALSNGLWRSQDGGQNWVRIGNGFNVTDFEFKPNDPNILYYTMSQFGFVTTLNLTTLTETFTSISTAVGVRRIELGVSAANPQAVYALVGPGYNTGGAGSPNGTAMYNGLYYSGDGAVSFTKRNDNIDIFALNRDQSWYDIALQINPANINEVIVGGVRTYRSTDGGVNFSELNASNPQLHGDVHGIERNPLNGFIYLGDDGGIYRSADNGVSWSNASNGLIINEFYRISGFAGNNNLVIGGTQDNGQFVRPLNSSTFSGGVLGLDGMDNIIDFSNSSTMYACVQNGGLYKSTNGSTFGAVAVTGGGGNWITPIIQSPANAGTIFYGASSAVLRSTNGGAAWASIGGQGGTDCIGIGTDGTNTSLYTSAGSFMRRSDNPGAAIVLWTTLPRPNTNRISAIAVNPANKNEIWISCTGYTEADKVYRSTDGGTTWANLSLSLPNVPLHSIAFANNINSPSGAIYVGTEIGVYYTDDGMPDWEPFYNGLPRVPVTDLFVNYNTGDITAATFGRGLWRSEAYTSCPGSYSIYSTVTGNRFFQSSGSISSAQVVPGSAGNELRLRAPTNVVLIDGFRALAGSYLHIVNGPCGSGVVARAGAKGQPANVVSDSTSAKE